MKIIKFRTSSGSIYEVDQDNSQFRKVNEPWKKYSKLIALPQVGSKVWLWMPGDRYLLTSKVVELEPNDKLDEGESDLGVQLVFSYDLGNN